MQRHTLLYACTQGDRGREGERDRKDGKDFKK
jgi:hypothetical protein